MLLAPWLLLAACAQAAFTIERPAASYDRAAINTPQGAQKVKATGNLGGVAGWFDYDFDVPADGWYTLVLNGNGWEAEFYIDPQGDAPARGRYYQANSAGLEAGLDKIGNFYLPRGRHTVRLKHTYWTGFQGIAGLSLQPAADENVARTVRVTLPGQQRSFRVGECPALEVQYGPRRTPGVLPVHWLNVESPTLRTSTVSLPPTAALTTMKLTVPCSAEGNFQYYFNGGPDKIANRDLHPISYEVIDTRAAPEAGGPARRELVLTIDTVGTRPDYAAGETRIVQRPFGAYRESDDHGWLDYLHSRLKLGEPSWFAYVLKGLAKQQPYMVEIDYPDDAERTFAIALRESDPLAYPVAGGVDSGGEFPLTQRMQTHTLLFWPRAADPRIVFLPARNGGTAAAARIRVYRVLGALPPLVDKTAGRRFVNWYEEGSNFFSMYGAPAQNPVGARIALERWAQALAYMGGDTLWPTVAVYSFALYPSLYHKAFSRPWEHDLLRQMLLVAEKHRLKVVPELHPRADELSWPYASAPDPKPNRLVSRDGRTHDDLPPFYNPLLPANQDWYVGMVGELADRYADSPALDGVSLRFMQWKNPTLHNFHSLEWGYDDATVAQFEKDTGVRVPVDAGDPRRFAARYRWLMANARSRWIDWRCAKVAQLLTRIRDRVRQARADLTVYVPVFPMTEGGSTYNRGTAWLREAGLDPRLVNRIEGVALVNALHTYGRRADGATNALLRGNLLLPDQVHALARSGEPARFLPSASYFEATEAIAPADKLGFPANTKKTWMSAVINPAGRAYLERYAVLLAEADAQMLGDGGNAYTLGQPELREFLAEYRRLPALPFRARQDAREPVAVWEGEAHGSYYFYAVNRTARPVKLQLAFGGQGSLQRLSAAGSVPLEGDALEVDLAPFQLLAWRASGSLRIARAASVR